MTQKELTDYLGFNVTPLDTSIFNGTVYDAGTTQRFREDLCFRAGKPMPEMPSLSQRAANFALAAAQAVKGLAQTGKLLGSKEHGDARLAVCKGCEKFIPATQHCSLCGCNIPFKVRLPAMKCPYKDTLGNAVDKWADADRGFL